ncbi:MAG: cytochrome P450, partial [Micromonosporaceae bacterium]
MSAVSLKDLHTSQWRRDPYAYYAQLHRQGAAAPLTAAADRYRVIVYGYDAVDRVLKDAATFRLMDGDYMDAASGHWRDHIVLRTLKDSVFFVNDAVHARMRHLFTSVFTPRRVTALEPAIARLTENLLDRLATLGRDGAPLDFMAEFAFPLPSNVIGELLGVPEEDRAWFRPRVRAVSEIFELDGSTWSNMRAADTATEELLDYFADLAAKRRVEPGDDLVSGLVAAHHGEALGDAELLANLIALFNAGFVTTTHLFGCGLTLLLQHPDMLAELRDDPAVGGAYIEEMLRFVAPTHFLIRYASTDTEVAGVPIAKGDSVVVAIAAANR